MDSKIVVFDGLRTPQAKFQYIIDTLNKALIFMDDNNWNIMDADVRHPLKT
ncbi:hypothetical protein [Oryza sativa Japonica Group]|uniref:Uncharacterized protein n=1 Tax=Oryza sativa subsp. japonica TaxID=39947 RepID=Q656G5_ORYSJ|nr:hypothetical protein [Oryza sativa Japonica Group]BAD45305.1 hypothetical protein [Oryza sativa Japonica Group]